MNNGNQEWKKSAVEGTEFTESDLKDETDKLRILSFRLDGRGENTVSSIDGTIVFIDRWYSGEKVKVGDVWLCSVKRNGSVYHAMPMKKITVDILLGTSEELRESIVDTLWSNNRKDYEKIFEERFKAELKARIQEEADSDKRQLANKMQSQIDSLMKQVEQTNFLLATSSGDDEIVLTSEPLNEQNTTIAESTQASNTSNIEATPASRPSSDIFRESENALYSESFRDGRYKAYISPDHKMIVLLPDLNGMALCSKKRITLNGLDALSPFDGRKSLPCDWATDKIVRIFI